MEITNDPPFIIYFVNEKGQVQEQFVENEWLPIKCNNCKGYGHNMAECKHHGPKIWAKKTVTDNISVGVNTAAEIQGKAAISGVPTGNTMVTQEPKETPDMAGPVKPWLIVGDFNVVFHFDDKASEKSVSAAEIYDSTAWIAQMQMAGLKSIGSKYTWSNRKDGKDRVYSKIDHAFINENWVDALPNTIAEFQWDVNSGHCYCLIKTPKLGNLGTKPFRFFNLWIAHRGFKEVVRSSWNKPMAVTGLQGVINKLLRLKHVLKAFNKEEIGDEAEKDAAANYQFHSTMYRSFLNDLGVIIDDYSQVVTHFLDHFREYMGSTSSATRSINTHCIGLGPCLDIEMHLKLIRKFQKSNVKKALFSIPGTKSPGPDGFGSEFYKAMWQDIGAEISKAILEFFNSGKIPAELNKTVLAMVPKTDMSCNAIDYRPIACCNTIYKCISKMLCSRISEVLPTLVSPNQGAFIKGRLLAHNILIFQDLIKNYNRRNASPRCALKIDLSKAYDTVD
ncbi:uncharacterized protein LOC133796123 [Humulus lupulus]|uniref:uncharacterized protein LOC133796123 n=1 Tax=Humulus lupulus TaxID=3486 RepID=UPI002B404E3D|nr:uncharacterized protein LOC133796123 [Humulus lupulus]